MQTDGKGLSDDEATFRRWMLDISINDKASAVRVKDLGGEWKRRCELQLAKWKN
jgi:hypothetical protein